MTQVRLPYLQAFFLTLVPNDDEGSPVLRRINNRLSRKRSSSRAGRALITTQHRAATRTSSKARDIALREVQESKDKVVLSSRPAVDAGLHRRIERTECNAAREGGESDGIWTGEEGGGGGSTMAAGWRVGSVIRAAP